MGTNPNLAAPGMPPEFQFRPTKMIYDEPPGNVIYEDALGSSGTSYLDPANQRRMDPIHWSRAGGVANMQRTAHGLISHMVHSHRASWSPKTVLRKFERGTLNTTIVEPKGARRPRLKGHRTPEEVARGAKAQSPALKPQASPSDMAKIMDPRRGFRRGRSRALESFLRSHPRVARSLASRVDRRREKANAERVRVGGAEVTQSQYASMPPGYVKELLRRRAMREARRPKPQVAFDPRESKGLATHGEYSTIPRPGTVEVAPGKYMRPEQLGMEQDVAIGAFGAVAQPKASSPLRDAALIGGIVVFGVLGAALLLRR